MPLVYYIAYRAVSVKRFFKKVFLPYSFQHNLLPACLGGICFSVSLYSVDKVHSAEP